MRSPLRRHATLLSLVAVATLVVVVVTGWMVVRPAASERDPLPDPIRIATVPGPAPGPAAGTRPFASPDPAVPGTGSGDVPDPSVAPPAGEGAPAPVDPAPVDPAPADPAPADVVPPPPLPDDDTDDDADDDRDGEDDGDDDDGDD